MARRDGSLPPLEWIRVFEAAGRTGNFTEAARQLGLTQAAVSQRIRNLERYLGTTLFEREARGVSLSSDGEAWLPHVQGALAALARSTSDYFGTRRSRVTIAASSSVIQLWIVPRLARLRQRFPDMELSLATVHREPDFATAEADLEIRFGQGNWPERRGVRLYRESLLPVAAPDLLKRAKEWRDMPLIGLSGPRIGWQDWCAAVHVEPPPPPALRMDTMAQALKAAEAGAGVVLGSLALSAQALADGRLIKLAEKPVEMDSCYWITWPGADPGFVDLELIAACLVDQDPE